MFSLKQIAEALGADVAGNANLMVAGASEPGSAQVDDLALAMDPKYAEGLAQGAARAAMLWGDAPWEEFGLEGAILVKRARYAMSGLTQLLDAGPDIAPGIHPSAVVDPSATIGAGAAIGPLAFPRAALAGLIAGVPAAALRGFISQDRQRTRTGSSRPSTARASSSSIFGRKTRRPASGSRCF